MTTLESPASSTARKAIVAVGEWESEGPRSPNHFIKESGGATPLRSGSDQR